MMVRIQLYYCSAQSPTRHMGLAIQCHPELFGQSASQWLTWSRNTDQAAAYRTVPE
jgi:hypothetical protein